jgi:nucleotide-binding universal stress UspA family protein
MFKRILWATDGSPGAERALAVAKELASEDGATLTVAHVVQKIATSGDKALAWNANEEDVQEGVKHVAAELSESGLTVIVRIVNHVGPQPAHLIADLAREADADLIVVGSRGRGTIPGVLLGSVVQRLLHVAPCPLLVVPPADRA